MGGSAVRMGGRRDSTGKFYSLSLYPPTPFLCLYSILPTPCCSYSLLQALKSWRALESEARDGGFPNSELLHTKELPEWEAEAYVSRALGWSAARKLGMAREALGTDSLLRNDL